MPTRWLIFNVNSPDPTHQPSQRHSPTEQSHHHFPQSNAAGAKKKMSPLPNFPNIYTHRKVADTAAKACEICFKSSASVLVTPDKQDFFYVCPVHLKQTHFCTPIVDKAAQEARKKKEMEEEVERVKKEYEERQQRKKKEEDEKEKAAKEKDKDKDKDKDESEKPKSPSPNDDTTPKTAADDTAQQEEEPRVFALHRTFYQGRLARKRQAEMDKRSRERLENPNFFPSVPKGLP